MRTTIELARELLAAHEAYDKTEAWYNCMNDQKGESVVVTYFGTSHDFPKASFRTLLAKQLNDADKRIEDVERKLHIILTVAPCSQCLEDAKANG